MEFEYKVAWCEFCDQGWIEIVKERSTKNLVLQCSECAASWENMDMYKDDCNNKESYEQSFDDEEYDDEEYDDEEYDDEEYDDEEYDDEEYDDEEYDELVGEKPDYQEIKEKGWEKYILKDW